MNNKIPPPPLYITPSISPPPLPPRPPMFNVQDLSGSANPRHNIVKRRLSRYVVYNQAAPTGGNVQQAKMKIEKSLENVKSSDHGKMENKSLPHSGDMYAQNGCLQRANVIATNVISNGGEAYHVELTFNSSKPVLINDDMVEWSNHHVCVFKKDDSIYVHEPLMQNEPVLLDDWFDWLLYKDKIEAYSDEGLGFSGTENASQSLDDSLSRVKDLIDNLGQEQIKPLFDALFNRQSSLEQVDPSVEQVFQEVVNDKLLNSVFMVELEKRFGTLISEQSSTDESNKLKSKIENDSELPNSLVSWLEEHEGLGAGAKAKQFLLHVLNKLNYLDGEILIKGFEGTEEYPKEWPEFAKKVTINGDLVHPK